MTLVNSENKLSLLADICQHEGANLKYDCDLKNKCMSACAAWKNDYTVVSFG